MSRCVQTVSQHLSIKNEVFVCQLLWLYCFKNPIMLWVHQTRKHWVNNKNMNATQGLMCVLLSI